MEDGNVVQLDLSSQDCCTRREFDKFIIQKVSQSIRSATKALTVSEWIGHVDVTT